SMTIGFAARNVLRADQRAAAALVVDHHRCAQVICHAFGHGATHEVGGAARREGNDDRDGAIGEVVGQCHRGGGKGAQGCYQTCSQPLLKLHALSPYCSNIWNDVSVLLIISYSEDSRQSVRSALYARNYMDSVLASVVDKPTFDGVKCLERRSCK